MKKLLMLVLPLAFFLSACDSSSDRTAQLGDTVVINFAGFMDGVQFPGGTAEGFPLMLGSGQFIPGFEGQLVGAKRGEEREVTLAFPTEYHVPELAGQDVVFQVKVLEIR